MRLLLLMAIVYLAYRIVRAWVVRNLQTLGRSDASHPEIDDVMVQDPICGIYFPRREGVALQQDGQTHLFCSTACRDRFIAQRQ